VGRSRFDLNENVCPEQSGAPTLMNIPKKGGMNGESLKPIDGAIIDKSGGEKK
jgi:hypothetical protein